MLTPVRTSTSVSASVGAPTPATRPGIQSRARCRNTPPMETKGAAPAVHTTASHPMRSTGCPKSTTNPTEASHACTLAVANLQSRNVAVPPFAVGTRHTAPGAAPLASSTPPPPPHSNLTSTTTITPRGPHANKSQNVPNRNVGNQTGTSAPTWYPGITSSGVNPKWANTDSTGANGSRGPHFQCGILRSWRRCIARTAARIAS